MFNQNLLKAKAIERGVSIAKLASEIGKSEPTFYRKLARNGDFSRFEISKIVNALSLTQEETNNIFLLNPCVNARKRRRRT